MARQDKRQKAKLLIELDHLIRYGGDAKRVAKIRAELDKIGNKRECKHQKETSRERVSREGSVKKTLKDKTLLKKQVSRLKAMNLGTLEIAFALGVSSKTVLETIGTIDDFDNKVEDLRSHKLVAGVNRRWTK